MTPDLQSAFGDDPIPPLPETLPREVHDYFVAWLAWVDAGAPDGEPFWCEYGLCSNAETYGGPIMLCVVSSLWEDAHPFGQQDYWSREDEGTQHKCPRRLAWVRAAALLPIRGEKP